MPAPTARTATPFHMFAGRDLSWLVEHQAGARPEKVFLLWESFCGSTNSWTFAQFAEEVRAYAAGLKANGVRPGDFVTIHMDNCPEFLFAWYACSRAGAIAVTTNTGSTADELGYFIAHSGSVVAITQPRYAELVKACAPALRWIACTEFDGDQAPLRPRAPHMMAFEALRGDPSEAPRLKVDPLAPNSIQYTSGTTSRPKGVVWTHANALWTARTTAARLRLTDQDTCPVFFPLFHTNALALSILSTLWTGGTAVLMPRYSASRFWEIATRHHCTWASMVMFTVKALEERPDPPGHHFRLWACAGDLAFVRDRWGIKTMGWFGMTETLTACIASDLSVVGPEGAMGLPQPEYEISIRDENGAEVAFGAIGRLYIRGVSGLSLFLEYLNDPEATADAFDADGWFDTGDEVTSLASGEIFFAGRAKDMLKVGAENVAALEIEMVINGVPGVVESAVVGKPDPMLDEVPVAFVVADDPGAQLLERIHAACEEALSAFKRPREVRFVDALPTGLLGKTLKKELRDRAAREPAPA